MSLTPPTLDKLAADPVRAASLPVEVVEALLSQCHVIEGALLTRLLAAQARADGQPEASGEGDRLLTIAEVADFLGVPKGYAYELARRGEIPTVRFGKYVRVALTAFREYVARHQENRLDKICSDRLQSTRDRLRGATNPRTVGTHASGIRQTRGGPSGNRRQVGDRRVAHSRTGGPADSASGEDRHPGEA